MNIPNIHLVELLNFSVNNYFGFLEFPPFFHPLFNIIHFNIVKCCHACYHGIISQCLSNQQQQQQHEGLQCGKKQLK